MQVLSPYSLTRKIIESTVTRGISDIQSDSKRAVRRLADLGKHFSKTKVHNGVFSIMQDILKNEDSPYYEAVSQIVDTVEISILKKFGLNFGYNSLTFGASKINKLVEECEYRIPWIIDFFWNPTLDSGLNLTHIDTIIKQGKELGIYCYCIHQKSYGQDWEKITDLFNSHPDCAFFWYFNAEVAEDHHFQSPLDNVMVLVNSDNASSIRSTNSLKQLNALYGIVKEYSSLSEVTPNDLSSINSFNNYDTHFVFYLAKEDCDEETKNKVSQLIYETRLHPQDPIFFFDFFSDIERMDKLVSIKSGVLQINYDATILSPKNPDISVAKDNISLEEVLSKCMPTITKI